MNNFPIQHDGHTYWIARNMAVTCFVFAPIQGEWCVLANQRGKGTPDFQGYWNAPCGYLDFDETTKEAAMREVFEETGIRLKSAKLWGFEDSPKANLQNVTFRYYSIITNPQPNNVSVNMNTEIRGGEENEVEAISWIRLSNIDKFNWAFGHDKLIVELATELELI